MNKQLQIARIAAAISKRNPDFDIQKIDLEHEIDEKLTYPENLANIKQKYKNLFEQFDKDKAEIEQKIHIEEETEKAFEKSIKVLKSQSSQNVSRYFSTPKSFINTLLGSEKINGLIIEGSAGLGKSHITYETLTENNKKLNNDFYVVNAHITPLEMYSVLFENSTKIIVFEDIPSIFKNETSIGLLLSALWGMGDRRIVNYFSTTDRLANMPKSFEFTGKIIILCNKMPGVLEPLKSRCFYLKVEFDFKTKIEILYELAKIHSIDFEIVDFIKNTANESYEINFRTLFKLNEVFKRNKQWENLAKEQMEFNSEKAAFLQILKLSISVDEQVRKARRELGISRATFFRWKREMNL